MSAFIVRFKQLLKLSLSDIRIILIALILLPLTAFFLRIKGFKWTQSLLSRCLPIKILPHIPQTNQLVIAKSIAKMVSVAANHGPYRANCLKKTLVSWWLLSRKGIQTELKIGVNKDEGNFNAHSWLELQGEVLNDTADVDERFSVFQSCKSQKS